MHFLGRCGCSLLFVGLICTSRLANSVEDDVEVARVGSNSIRLATVSQRLLALAPFQRKVLGSSPPAQARRLLEEVLIPEKLLAEQGRKTPLATGTRMQARTRALLRQLLLDRWSREIITGSASLDASAKTYFDAHPELFLQKRRIRLQRLLVETQAEAVALIDKAKGFANMDDWRNLVREKSLDKATSERGGELGFVAADGTTDAPELEVDKALFLAADDAKDGELIGRPIAEGKRFAVLWRRGSRAEKAVDFHKELPKLRQYLFELLVEEKQNLVVNQLRTEHLRDYRPTLLEGRDFAKLFETGSTDVQPAASASN